MVVHQDRRLTASLNNVSGGVSGIDMSSICASGPLMMAEANCHHNQRCKDNGFV